MRIIHTLQGGPTINIIIPWNNSNHPSFQRLWGGGGVGVPAGENYARKEKYIESREGQVGIDGLSQLHEWAHAMQHMFTSSFH